MLARELTPDRLASAGSLLGAAGPGLDRGHAAAAEGISDAADGTADAQTLGMPEAYEHFWGVDFGSSPQLPAPGGADVQGAVPMGGMREVDTAERGVGRGQGAGWERFSVLSSTSVSAARVCGEVLRDKSGEAERHGAAQGDGEAGTSPPRQRRHHVRRSQLGCCVVRAMS